jgi:hypothetical protein
VATAPIGLFSFTRGIRTPDQLVVESPRGGTVVSRQADLELRWRGAQGSLSIIVSAYDTSTRKAKPLLELRPRDNTGRAVVPAKFLRELRPLHRYFVFTFVLANRDQMDLPIPRAPRVLLQAASVYSTYIELR